MVMMGIPGVVVAPGCLVFLRPALSLVLRNEIVRLREIPASMRHRKPSLESCVCVAQHGLAQEIETVCSVVVWAGNQRFPYHRQAMDLVEHGDTEVPLCTRAEEQGSLLLDSVTYYWVQA